MLENGKRLNNEPIIIATLSGMVVADDLRRIFARSLELAEGMEGPIYRITDASQADAHFSDLMEIMQEVMRENPGSTRDDRFRPVLVGSNEAVQFVVKSMKQRQYGQIDLTLYGSLDEALAHVRAQIAVGG